MYCIGQAQKFRKNILPPFLPYLSARIHGALSQNTVTTSIRTTKFSKFIAFTEKVQFNSSILASAGKKTSLTLYVLRLTYSVAFLKIRLLERCTHCLSRLLKSFNLVEKITFCSDFNVTQKIALCWQNVNFLMLNLRGT
jgi:hypothetical protein